MRGDSIRSEDRRRQGVRGKVEQHAAMRKHFIHVGVLAPAADEQYLGVRYMSEEGGSEVIRFAWAQPNHDDLRIQRFEALRKSVTLVELCEQAQLDAPRDGFRDQCRQEWRYADKDAPQLLQWHIWLPWTPEHSVGRFDNRNGFDGAIHLKIERM